MIKAFRFRVLLDCEGDVFRDIEIRGDQTFAHFHKAIQDAFNFDDSQMASFYMSNENWDKGQEITIMDIPFDDGSKSVTMTETTIEDMVLEEGQKILYVFDFMLMWCFYIDTVKIIPAEKNGNYPKVVNMIGKAPNQYSKQVVINPEDDKLMLRNKNQQEMFEEQYGVDEEDLEEGFGEGDDLFEGFEDFDDQR